MCRLAIAVVVVAAACCLGIGAGRAQERLTPAQIVKSLTPTSTSGATRGIRIGPGATTAPSAPSVSLIVPFASGLAELTPPSVHVLDSLGTALSDASLGSYRFRIEGHTDTVGTRDYNKALSERRAATVRDYLARHYRIDAARLEPVGMGEEALLVATANQTAEPRNRRVQVVNLGR